MPYSKKAANCDENEASRATAKHNSYIASF